MNRRPMAMACWGEVFDSIYHLQRRDQRARGRLQAVIDRVQESTAALRDAIIMLDSDGNLEWWNIAAEQLLGSEDPQDSGQPISNLVRHPRFKEYFAEENYSEPLELPLADQRAHAPADPDHAVWQPRAPDAGA